MPGPKPVFVSLTNSQRDELMALAAARRTAAGLVRRARIVLLAAKGMSNTAISAEIGCDVKTARLWRARWAANPKVEALDDRDRPGRPPVVPAAVRAKLISLACERADADDKRPTRSVWSQVSLQASLLAATDHRLSTSEIGRILRNRGIRPHRVRMWLNSQDPLFQEKIDAICPFYTNPPDDVTVLCIDEKRLFAHRREPGLRPAGPGRDVRVNFDYSRHGSSVLIGCFEVKTGRVFGQCRPRRTAADLVEFMEEVADRYAGNVVVIWDNLNVHHDGKEARWTQFNERHAGRFTFLHTPTHASWCNQIEIWFSILERIALKHRSFPTVSAVEETTHRFINEWNERAKPFRWRFRGTRDWKHARWMKRHACSTARLLGRRRPHPEAA